jgi:D-3-phosphoglycerate dehydrogenase
MRRPDQLTIGLVGYGRIGRRVTEMLSPFGMSFLAYDPYLKDLPGVELVELDDLLQRADAVSLHSPLTEETRGLIGAGQLAKMKDTAVLVNTSRGPLIQLDALIDALRTGQIAAAALDVFEQEPPDAAALAGAENLLMTPHIAFYSDDAIAESQTKAATQVAKALTDQPLDYLLN